MCGVITYCLKEKKDDDLKDIEETPFMFKMEQLVSIKD